MAELQVRGQVRNGALELAAPLDLPDGTEVELTVRELAPPASVPTVAPEVIQAVAGMWAHHPEMADSEGWVRRLRGGHE